MPRIHSSFIVLLLISFIASCGPNSQLRRGLSRVDAGTVQRALNDGANPDRVFSDRRTPSRGYKVRGTGLQYLTTNSRISASARLELVKLLLDAKADPNFLGGSCQNPLSEAMIIAEDGPVALALIEAGADVNATTCGKTVLAAAIWNYIAGTIEQDVLRTILDLGAEVQPSTSGDPLDVLMHAYSKYNDDEGTERTQAAAVLLLRHGADPGYFVKLRRERHYKAMKESAEALFAAAASDILSCFHPSQGFIGAAISSNSIVSESQGRLDGIIRMKGLSGRYSMEVRLEYDVERSAIRVTPMRENTHFGANPDCELRSWSRVSSIGAAARASTADFTAKVVGVGAVLVGGAVLLSSAEARSKVARCVSKAIADGAIDSTVESTVTSPVAQAIMAGALKQAYDEKGGASGAASGAIAYALKQALQERSPQLAKVVEAAELVHCMVK